MDGTQRPMKMPAFSSPLNQRISEKIRDINAATRKRKSAVVNFFIIIYCLKM